jgi:hypothetical protein
MAAGANTHVKRFADACRKDKKGVTKDITLKGIALEGIVSKSVLCRKDKESEQRREKVITSPVKVELRRLRRDIVIISLSLISVFASLSFVQTYCSSF